MAEGEVLAANSLAFQVIDFIRIEFRKSSNPGTAPDWDLTKAPPPGEKAFESYVQIKTLAKKSRRAISGCRLVDRTPQGGRALGK
jgi:hypothetical protein